MVNVRFHQVQTFWISRRRLIALEIPRSYHEFRFDHLL
jgi:hypothetical protein